LRRNPRKGILWSPGFIGRYPELDGALSVVDRVSTGPSSKDEQGAHPSVPLVAPEARPPDLAYVPRSRAARSWLIAKEVWHESMPLWFPLLSVLTAVIAGLFFDQTQGILQALLDPVDEVADKALASAQRWQLLFFLVGICLWSVINFLATGLLHQFDYNSPEYAGRLSDRSGRTGRVFHWLEKWSPVITGLGPAIALEIAIIVLGNRYRDAHPTTVQFTILLFTPAFAILALLAFRPWRTNPPSKGKRKRDFGVKIPKWVKILSAALFAFIAALVIVTAFSPEYWSLIGPAATLCVVATVFVTMGSVLVFLGGRWRIPLISICLLVCIAFSFVNDNHRVRMPRPLPVGMDSARENGHRMVEALPGWRDRLSLDEEIKPGQKTPLFIICAEGGGLRAAYWTARLLAYLEDTTRKHPEQYVPFSTRVLAISGVSGGSLGAATFSALLDRNPVKDATPAKSDWFFDRSLNFLARDQLSAPLAAAAFVDTTQRIIPYPVFRERDRAAGLEKAWEFAWRRSLRTFGDDPDGFLGFDGDFRDLWRKRGNPLKREGNSRWMPSLFLNGTSVELGGRIIVSDCLIQSGDYPGAQDALRLLQLRSLGEGEKEEPVAGLFRLSTAVNFSTRFPGISPSGEIPGLTDQWAQRVVDGGYYDNSGARTAWDNLVPVYYDLQKNAVQTQKPSEYVPWVIIIRAGPQTKRETPSRSQNSPSVWSWLPKSIQPYAQHLMVDLLAPSRAFLNSWKSRSGDSAEALKDGTCLISRDLAGNDKNTVTDCADLPVERVDYSPTLPRPEKCQGFHRDPFVIELNLELDELGVKDEPAKADTSAKAVEQKKKYLIPLGWMLPRSAMEVMNEEIRKRLAPEVELLNEKPERRDEDWFRKMQRTQLGRVLTLLHRERPGTRSQPSNAPRTPTPTPTASPSSTPTPIPTPSPPPPIAIASPTPGPCGKTGPHKKLPICLPPRRAAVQRIR
jgi:hypothetical protein